MNTLNGVEVSKVSKNEALLYCIGNRDQYIREFDSIDEGIRSFDCLYALLQDGDITSSDLPEYGMCDQDL